MLKTRFEHCSLHENIIPGQSFVFIVSLFYIELCLRWICLPLDNHLCALKFNYIWRYGIFAIMFMIKIPVLRIRFFYNAGIHRQCAAYCIALMLQSYQEKGERSKWHYLHLMCISVGRCRWIDTWMYNGGFYHNTPAHVGTLRRHLLAHIYPDHKLGGSHCLSPCVFCLAIQCKNAGSQSLGLVYSTSHT